MMALDGAMLVVGELCKKGTAEVRVVCGVAGETEPERYLAAPKHGDEDDLGRGQPRGPLGALLVGGGPVILASVVRRFCVACRL